MNNGHYTVHNGLANRNALHVSFPCIHNSMCAGVSTFRNACRTASNRLHLTDTVSLSRNALGLNTSICTTRIRNNNGGRGVLADGVNTLADDIGAYALTSNV